MSNKDLQKDTLDIMSTESRIEWAIGKFAYAHTQPSSSRLTKGSIRIANPQARIR